jgi:hypothetical protein
LTVTEPGFDLPNRAATLKVKMFGAIAGFSKSCLKENG